MIILQEITTDYNLFLEGNYDNFLLDFKKYDLDTLNLAFQEAVDLLDQLEIYRINTQAILLTQAVDRLTYIKELVTDRINDLQESEPIIDYIDLPEREFRFV